MENQKTKDQKHAKGEHKQKKGKKQEFAKEGGDTTAEDQFGYLGSSLNYDCTELDGQSAKSRRDTY